MLSGLRPAKSSEIVFFFSLLRMALYPSHRALLIQANHVRCQAVQDAADRVPAFGQRCPLRSRKVSIRLMLRFLLHVKTTRCIQEPLNRSKWHSSPLDVLSTKKSCSIMFELIWPNSNHTKCRMSRCRCWNNTSCSPNMKWILKKGAVLVSK